MASLQTGSGQVTQRIDNGLVDPRLLAADFGRIGRGIGEGMELANNYYAAQENAALRPNRKTLSDLQVAAAQEYADNRANRDTLAALNIDNLNLGKTRTQQQIAQGEYDANLRNITPVRGKLLKSVAKGGYFDSVRGVYVPTEIVETYEQFDPKTNTSSTIDISSIKETPTDVENRIKAQGLNTRLTESEIAKRQADVNKLSKAGGEVKSYIDSIDNDTGYSVRTFFDEYGDIVKTQPINGFGSASALELYNNPSFRAMRGIGAGKTPKDTKAKEVAVNPVVAALVGGAPTPTQASASSPATRNAPVGEQVNWNADDAAKRIQAEVESIKKAK